MTDPGINDFKGHIRHSSNWDRNFDPRGKRIATIGNGASGETYAVVNVCHANNISTKEFKSQPSFRRLQATSTIMLAIELG